MDKSNSTIFSYFLVTFDYEIECLTIDRTYCWWKMKNFIGILSILFLTLTLFSSKALAVPTFVDSFSVDSQ